MQLLSPPKFHTVLMFVAMVAILFSLPQRCFADPVTLSSSAFGPTTLGPSSDSLSLKAGSIRSDDSDTGPTTFQAGDFLLGDSEIPDQVVLFSIGDTLTLNGITEVLNIFGQDDVTTTADTLSILAGGPVMFGSDVFTLQPFTETGTAIGQDMPIELQGSVTPTPEPGSLVLLGTGIIAALLLATFSRRSLVASIPAMTAPPIFSTPAPGRTWVRRGASFHPAASDAAGPSLAWPPASAPAEPRPADDFQID